MSSAYSLEPQTEGKECPKAVRNFVQLSMEGYYDGCVFHRVIKDFMVQTGDPTNTGNGGESIYGKEFRDEIHSRLRFSHRGLVAMASSGPNTNGSQFFLTLSKCEWLNGKHTIFGRISGDSIYNAMQIAECEVDEQDRPTAGLTTVKSIEVLWNPFDDCFPRVSKLNQVEPTIVDVAAERKKKKKQKNLALLSFGEEQGEADAEVKSLEKKLGGKSKSSHDCLDEEGLSSTVDKAVEAAASKEHDDTEQKKRADLRRKVAEATKQDIATKAAEADPDQIDFAERMRKQMQGKKSEKQLERAEQQRMEEMIEYSDSEPSDQEQEPTKTKLSLKKIRQQKQGGKPKPEAGERLAGAGDDPEYKISGERSGAERREKRRLKSEIQSHEQATLSKLASFTAALQGKRKDKDPVDKPDASAALDAASAGKKRKLQKEEIDGDPPKHSWLDAESEEEDEEDDDTWMTHDLTFQRTAADRRKEREEMNGLVTLDPRQQKGGKKQFDGRSQHERRLKPGVRKDQGRW